MPIPNRIATGMSLISWGAEDGQTGSNDAIMMGDCYPMDSKSSDRFRVSGEKIEEPGRLPTPVHMFAKMARKQAMLYAAVYGQDHLNERLDAIERLIGVHDECPEFSASQFLSETWDRMVYQYDA